MHTKKTYLRIKVLSLAAEAKLIRNEEARWVKKDGKKDHPIRWGLHHHRIFDVRNEQRAALLAYGFLRGRRYKQLEAKCYTQPKWGRVLALVTKYGANPDQEAMFEELRVWRGN